MLRMLPVPFIVKMIYILYKLVVTKVIPKLSKKLKILSHVLMKMKQQISKKNNFSLNLL